jgi:hypothetical protein
MRRIFVAGEGPHDIGRWAQELPWRSGERGFLEAVLAKVRPDGWEIVEGLQWKRIPKYRSGDHRRPEQRTVLGLIALARNRGCDLVAFLRDHDGDDARPAAIAEALAERAVDDPDVIAGVPVRTVDAWVLAILGERATERLRDPKADLEARSVRTRSERAAVVDARGFADVPDDARSLRTFLAEAERALGG